MRALCLEDLLRAAEALAGVPPEVQERQVQDWLYQAHCMDKAHKRGAYCGAGDLASVLPNRKLALKWTGSDDDLARLSCALGQVLLWKQNR